MNRVRLSPDLPDDIGETLAGIIVDRQGDDAGAYMRTEAVIGHVAPGEAYRLEVDRLVPLDGAATPAVAPVAPGRPPPHVRLRGAWNPTETVASADANIFGGLGTLTLDRSDMAIPEAPPTPEALAYYGARLYRHGDGIAFETDRNMPVTITDIGPAYADGFLHVPGLGSGAFIEHHAPPHLHMPLEDSARGHMLLGRSDGDDYRLSAFPIPYGSALYTSGHVLHADPYLVGRHLIVYAATQDYSTVVFRAPDGTSVIPRIGPA